MKAFIASAFLAIGLGLSAAAWAALPAKAASRPQLGLAMHGVPLQPDGVTSFPYLNPKAPKGGTLVLGKLGSYDSLNPFIVLGDPAAGLTDYVYETLCTRALDEPFTLYGLIAKTIQTPPDRSYVQFELNPKARFSDGTPITPADVIFSWKLLRDHGRPNYRIYYRKVVKAEQIGTHGVRFVFDKSGDREMPLIMGLLPILPKHAINPKTFEQTSLKAPIGSGPYIVSSVQPGRSITYTRNPHYWGARLGANRGRFNFNRIRIEYYRDANSMFQAFKAGLIDFREETEPTRWTQAYDFPAARAGRVKKEALPIGVPAGMSALVFNTRRAPFSDRRVRQALIDLFDFQWMNRTLYHGQFARTESYFARSILSSHGRPADATERALLKPFPHAVTPSIMNGTYALPVTDGHGENRKGREAALKLLYKAGFVLKNGVLVNGKTGLPFRFEMLAVTRAQERLFLTYARDLKQVGIQARIRQVDATEYQRRLDTFDFDMIQYHWPSSLSPGNEQAFRWSSAAAKTQGSFNYAGVKNPAVDAMIKALLEAKDEKNFVSSVRALDRVLLSGDYVIPLFYLPDQWVAYWTDLHRPKQTPLFGYLIDSWWMSPAKTKAGGRPAAQDTP